MGPEREDRGRWDRREEGTRVRKVKGGARGENGEKGKRWRGEKWGEGRWGGKRVGR